MITKERAHPPASEEPLAIISRQLESYAERGVFRSFSHVGTPARTGAPGTAEDEMEFRFSWLWNLPFRLIYHGKKKTFSFPELFPNIESRSALEKELKTFIRELSSQGRPEHRRLDAGRVVVRYTNRGKAGTLAFLFTEGDYEYAVKKALNVVNEIFVDFLKVRHSDYMVKNLRLPEEV